MAPIEELHSRDLAWISEFVMQQMVLMMRPLMEHVQQTDVTLECAQRAVQRLHTDLSEVRGEIERNSKSLGILRQGLGVQNESKCMLQRSMDSAARTVKRLDEQMDTMLVVWQRDLRELREQRQSHLVIAAPDSWDQKKTAAHIDACEGETCERKRIGRPFIVPRHGLLQQEDGVSPPHFSSSRVTPRGSRLPLLGTKLPGAAGRSPEGSYSIGTPLRFSEETICRPPSQGHSPR